MADVDLIKKLGIKLTSDGEIACQASNEVHAICDYLMDQIELAQERIEVSQQIGDMVGVATMRVQQEVLLRAAEAIHSGAHLDYMGD